MSAQTPVPHHPIEGMSEAEDMLFAMVIALTAQLSATRERLDTVERLLDQNGLPGPEQVNAYQPDPAAEKARESLRKRLIARVFRPLTQSIETSATREKENG